MTQQGWGETDSMRGEVTLEGSRSGRELRVSTDQIMGFLMATPLDNDKMFYWVGVCLYLQSKQETCPILGRGC